MNILIKYGFTIEEFQNMLLDNPDISDITDNSILTIINYLVDNGCSNSQIRNILIANPYILSSDLDEISILIDRFKKLFDNINLLFDSNPFILNWNLKKLNNFISKMIDSDYSMEYIYDYLLNNIVL